MVTIEQERAGHTGQACRRQPEDLASAAGDHVPPFTILRRHPQGDSSLRNFTAMSSDRTNGEGGLPEDRHEHSGAQYVPRRRSRRTWSETSTTFPRTLTDAEQLGDLLAEIDDDSDVDVHEVGEWRDGFFSAIFLASLPHKLPGFNSLQADLPRTESDSAFGHGNVNARWKAIKLIAVKFVTTRAGMKMLKSFSGVFLAYVLCLIPPVSHWLGRYNYVLVISSLINHPGRTIGSQVEGCIATVLGTALGLAWGALATWASHASKTAIQASGGILAAFLVVFMVPLSAVRSYYIRLYQLVLTAGMAAIYACLTDVYDVTTGRKFFDYGVPWALGQAISLLCCCIIFPDAGAGPLAVSIHDALGCISRSLTQPIMHDDLIRAHLSSVFVDLTRAHRDLAIEVTWTRFGPRDMRELRNLLQAVIRAVLAFKPGLGRLSASLDDSNASSESCGASTSPNAVAQQSSQICQEKHGSEETIRNKDSARPSRPRLISDAAQIMVEKLGRPTRDLLTSMKTCLDQCDIVLTDTSGHGKYTDSPNNDPIDIAAQWQTLKCNISEYDMKEQELLHDPRVHLQYADPEVVATVLFSHPVRQAAEKVQLFATKVKALYAQRRKRAIWFPAYPLSKALQHANAQVRHDRGGVTAGFFFHNQSELAHALSNTSTIFQSQPSVPKRSNTLPAMLRRSSTFPNMSTKQHKQAAGRSDAYQQDPVSRQLRHVLWLILHRLQGFETRYGLKVAVVVSLLSIPAWLQQSYMWLNKHESWWAVITIWIMMHPRVGGNIQDLLARLSCVLIGTICGGVTYRASHGNSYGMATLAALYLVPMLYRFTQSSHPRSGFLGCLSFAVVSLNLKTRNDLPSTVEVSWTRGLAIAIGIVTAATINWFLWPFVSRHELRKALSNMMIYCAIVYRGVMARYVYFEKGETPSTEDIEKSEILEGHLREGFVRIRQLLEMTLHEPRLRGPFNAKPYAALTTSLERFFEYIIDIRQASLFFHPQYLSAASATTGVLLPFRRDAVAVVLMNLYILSTGLRMGCKVPRHLPSAPASRRRLLQRMSQTGKGRDRDTHDTLHANTQHRPTTGSSAATTATEASRTGFKDFAVKQEDTQRTTRPAVVTHVDASARQAQHGGDRMWREIYSYSYSQSLTGCVEELENLQHHTKQICGEQSFDIIGSQVHDANELG